MSERATAQGKEESPALDGNRVELLRDGREAFPRMLAAISNAKRTINLETYILRGDRTGERFSRELIAAARRGVEVNLSYDGFGSLGLRDSFLTELARAGVRVLHYHPVTRFPWHPRIRRNHRKSLIVDGRFGVVGGMNLADDYASLEQGGEGWRDNAIAFEGPAVRQLQELFVHSWNRHSEIALGGEAYFPALSPCGSHRVRVIGNQARHERQAIRRAYFHAMERAEKCILIANSYFIPDHGIRRVFTEARRRGVEVTVLTAGKTDLRSVRYAARATYSSMLKNGVRLFEWDRTVFHAKTAVVDGDWCTIGSYNLDPVSFFLNLEVTVVVEGPSFGELVLEMLRDDLSMSRPIRESDWKVRPIRERLLENLFYPFRHVM